MRVTAAYLSILCALSWQQAHADDPPAAPTTAAPSAVEPSSVPPAAEKRADAAPEAGQKAAPGNTSAVLKPGVTVVGSKPELTPEEKQLIARGYKLEMRQGEKYFCRREQQIGSRFETKICDTATSIEAHRAESQEAVRVLQNSNSRLGN
jgi:hypothetical protein